jgi:DtxR family Mn-dependent transcriptional regulator
MDKKPALRDLSLRQQKYMEVIGELVREKGQSSSTDVAKQMGVSLPSVSEAVKRLVELGLARRESRFEIGLTRAGERIATQLEERHRVLKRFMVEVMAMDKKKADEVACRVEHCIDKEFAERLKRLAEFLEQEYPWTLKGIAEYVHTSQEHQRTNKEMQFQI